jgi:predicted Zn-dependent peptidase
MTLRQEATKYFSEIPDSKLTVLLPLLKDYAENSLVIETDLTDEERQIIAEGDKEYNQGANFVSWNDYKKSRKK